MKDFLTVVCICVFVSFSFASVEIEVEPTYIPFHRVIPPITTTTVQLCLDCAKSSAEISSTCGVAPITTLIASSSCTSIFSDLAKTLCTTPVPTTIVCTTIPVPLPIRSASTGPDHEGYLNDMLPSPTFEMPMIIATPAAQPYEILNTAATPYASNVF